jgi:hypothetical protein
MKLAFVSILLGAATGVLAADNLTGTKIGNKTIERASHVFDNACGQAHYLRALSLTMVYFRPSNYVHIPSMHLISIRIFRTGEQLVHCTPCDKHIHGVYEGGGTLVVMPMW